MNVASSAGVLRIAVLGGGTVGSAVVRVLVDRAASLRPADGLGLELGGVVVRDFGRAVDRGVPSDLLSDAPAHLVASPDTDVVVELMGGEEPARTLIAAALEAGKPVVTANKLVIARHGPALEEIARRTGAALRFEAAVAGGIPVLSPLAEGLAGNVIHRVRGVVNGTTNHILTAMAEEGLPYEDALDDAKARGFAEADPRGDVEGDDAAFKLVILARLAFGTWLDPDVIVRRPPTVRGEGAPGITGLTDAEIEGAEALGFSMRLIAGAVRTADGGIAASVLPTAVPSASPFGWTTGVTNRIEIDGEPIGTIRIAGPGAGGEPTASAILGDLIAIARGGGSTWGGLPAAGGPSGGQVAAVPGTMHARDWYTFLAGVDLGSLPDSLADLAAVEFSSGVAVHLDGLLLDEARALLGPALAPDVDATLYPIAD
ncbi:MAG TPA: homoserine dehydrogenase [Candidatus Limnocylindrales bacterium]|nr:homoserine dehydrogenase [Candidatus Limnocylindrales bacterium]